jgi:hypothetical protein
MRLDGAMRALTVDSEKGGPAESFLRVLDQFAALHSYASATPTTGGYRVLGGQRATRKSAKPSLARRVAIRPATAGARMRLTGSLSVLFIGGLGLAVLAGPASCPCSSTFAQQASIERLGYVQNAAFMNASEAPAIALERVAFSDTEFLGPDTSATGISPITTSALEPAPTGPVAAADAGATKTVGPLPSSIERVSEATPETVKLAAATIVESDVIPEVPVAEVAAPPMPSVTAVEAEREVAPKTAVRTLRKRAAVRAYRTPTKLASRSKNSNDAMTAQRAPKWAQQMFTTPWQSQAFSYTR